METNLLAETVTVCTTIIDPQELADIKYTPSIWRYYSILTTGYDATFLVRFTRDNPWYVVVHHVHTEWVG